MADAVFGTAFALGCTVNKRRDCLYNQLRLPAAEHQRLALIRDDENEGAVVTGDGICADVAVDFQIKERLIRRLGSDDHHVDCHYNRDQLILLGHVTAWYNNRAQLRDKRRRPALQKFLHLLVVEGGVPEERLPGDG